MNNQSKVIQLILVLGLALRLVSWHEVSVNNPIFDLPIVDAKEYVDDATFYNDVNWLGAGGSYFHPPGYSYFIGIIFLFFGKSLLAIRLVQIGMDVANIYLLFLIVRKVFDGRVALLSALLYAIYARIIQYSVEILPPVFVIFLLLMSIYCLTTPLPALPQGERAKAPEGDQNNSLIPVIFSALFLGLLIITLPNFLLTIPVFILWIYFALHASGRNTRLKWMALFLAVSLFPVFLTALRNRVVADEALLISRNGGINFFIGNNPDIKKTVGATPGIEWDKLLMLPYQTERITDFQEQDDFFNRKAFDYVKNNFGDWAKLMCKKSLWYFSSYEFARNFDVYFFAQYSFITKYPVLNLGILFPLALAGIFAACRLQTAGCRLKNYIRQNIHILLLLGIFFIYSFSIILIFIAARYRLPVVPLMVIFAAAFLITLFDLAKEKKYKPLAAYLLLTGAFTLFAQHKFFKEEYPFKASPVFTHTLIANTLINGGKREEGKRYLEQALKLPADEATDDALFELAHYYRGTEETEKARGLFYDALRLDSLNFKCWNSLGFDYKMEKKFAEAIFCLGKGISAAPCLPELYLNLADCYLARQKTDSAIAALKSYQVNCPSPHPNISQSLGKICMDLKGDFEMAAKYYQEAIDYPQGFDPPAETYNRLGACWFKLGANKKAKDFWMKGLAIDPQSKAIRINIEEAKKEVPDWESL